MKKLIKIFRSLVVQFYIGLKLICNSNYRGMLGEPLNDLTSHVGQFPMVDYQTEDLIVELLKANSSRQIYEINPNLPLEDLFYIGGKLQSLIRKTEFHLNNKKFDCYQDRQNLNCRLIQTKDFRNYIVKRIKRITKV